MTSANMVGEEWTDEGCYLSGPCITSASERYKYGCIGADWKQSASGNLFKHSPHLLPRFAIMKCIAAVVMMSLAVFGVEAGLAPLFYSAPLAFETSHTTVVQSNPSAKLIATAPTLAYASAPLSYGAAPFYYPAPLAYSAPALLYQKEARYLAANRGAVHEAPLPGHAFSQQQLNLDAAPGSE
uniref:Uncharacterized protein n=1 Tax=Anopheles atroparvus TaxID=41427 RepID=A0AAG5D891_ANOAO